MQTRRFLVAAITFLSAGCRESLVDDTAPGDMAEPDLASPLDLGPDLAQNPGPKPLGGAVDTKGGTVDRLFFGFTGDTRPSNADDTANYPVATINGIFQRLADADVQFGVDLGDHMYVVAKPAEAPIQMGYYTTAAQKLGSRPLFMTMGNHDCNAGNCFYYPMDPNFLAYMSALKPISPLPYYSFTIQTRSGPAVFVIVSDNFSNSDEFTWFEKTLADADKTARYTIVARHHPRGQMGTTYALIEQTLARHKYTLFLTGHSHRYYRDHQNDPSGRTVVYGLGGVPNSGPDWGYGIVQQGLDDRLYVTVYEQATGMPTDSFSVAPQ